MNGDAALENAELLIVCDDEPERERISRMVTELGFPPPLRSELGDGALILARERLPLLAVVDIKSGQAERGISTGALLMARTGIPSLFLVDAAEHETLQRAMSLQAYGFISKPINEQWLHSALRVALGRLWAERLLNEGRDEDLLRANQQLHLRQEELEASNEELMRVQVALQDSLARYTDLYDQAPIGYLTLNADGAILKANVAGAAMLGVEKEDLGGQALRDWVPENQRNVFAEFLSRVMSGDGGQFCELALGGPGGAVDLVRMEGTSTQTKQGAQCLVAVVDLSQRKQAEERLREREELFRRMFDLSPIGAAMISPDFRFLRVNQELCRITGYGADELTSLSFPEITYPDDLQENVRQARAMVAGEIDHYQLDKRYLRKDGRIIWIRLSVRAVRDAQGRVSYLLPMMEDIDQAKRAMNVIRRNETDMAQKNKRLEDLNTALQVLMEHRERERKDFGLKLMANLKTLVFPYIELLRGKSLSLGARTVVDILQNNLSELASPLASTLSDPEMSLTPGEIRVADLVRQGKTSKEIAVLLNLSPRTVAFHRNNLRKKLGIGSGKGNLRTTLRGVMEK